MDQIELDHVSQVIGYHPSYLEHFLKIQTFIMQGDGPLPYDYRHYLAIIVSKMISISVINDLLLTQFRNASGKLLSITWCSTLWLTLNHFYRIRMEKTFKVSKNSKTILITMRKWNFFHWCNQSWRLFIFKAIQTTILLIPHFVLATDWFWTMIYDLKQFKIAAHARIT